MGCVHPPFRVHILHGGRNQGDGDALRVQLAEPVRNFNDSVERSLVDDFLWHGGQFPLPPFFLYVRPSIFCISSCLVFLGTLGHDGTN